MEYRLLGAGGLKLSEICLGVRNFGDSAAERQAASIVSAARDAGVNFVDTANGYSPASSVGRASRTGAAHSNGTSSISRALVL